MSRTQRTRGVCCIASWAVSRTGRVGKSWSTRISSTSGQARPTLACAKPSPQPARFTARKLRAELERATGHELRFVGFPWWAMTLLSPVWELARELREMRCLWNTPHSLSQAKFERLLPKLRPTCDR